MAKKPRNSRTLDVRPLIARGEKPFGAIMNALRSLGPGDEFVLITPFLPSPLIEKSGSEGFTARPEPRIDGGWQTRFKRNRGTGQNA